MDEVFKDQVATLHKKIADELKKVNTDLLKLQGSDPKFSLGEFSDGYHTFNELYDYRLAYHALYANLLYNNNVGNVHKSKRYSDGEPCFDGEYFIVNMTLPEGQVSNHYKMKHWDKFKCREVDLPEPWDGHTPEVALQRMLKTIEILPMRD